MVLDCHKKVLQNIYTANPAVVIKEKKVVRNPVVKSIE